jgi:hypothetical protein
MLRIIKVISVFLFGVALGATCMAYLAGRASVIYAKELQYNYSFEQQRQAALAAKSGQWLAAAMAYNNMNAAEIHTNKPFGVEHQEWALLLPLAAPILEKISSYSDPSGKGQRASASVSHARYAYALEKSGHFQEASIEWEKSMSGGTFKSIDAARETAILMLNQDIEFFNEH